MKTALRVLAYSLACGILLCFFAFVPGLIRYAFSLGALFLGIRFFRTCDKLSLRIVFILLAIVLYFVFSVIITIILYTQGMLPAPETGLHRINFA